MSVHIRIRICVYVYIYCIRRNTYTREAVASSLKLAAARRRIPATEEASPPRAPGEITWSIYTKI